MVDFSQTTIQLPQRQPTLREKLTKRLRSDRPRFDPRQVGWRLGAAAQPATGRDLWIPWDRTAGVYGPQGSGKTLDLLAPALIGAPGPALVTLTKVEDMLLTFEQRSVGDRPCVVLDPFGLAPGLPELIWDPIAGCVDPTIAERRAKAFAAGTVLGSSHDDAAARFYAGEAAKVLQAYFHAAALAALSLDDVLEWVASPLTATAPAEILQQHPHAERFWHGLLTGALRGDDRTAGNTTATVHQAMALFFQTTTRTRCVPGPGRAATDIRDVLARGGTVYLLGREDPYTSASPLMTAVAEDVLDTALQLATSSTQGRLCPPMLACLDELPSTAPIPTLGTRMANERALGLSFIYATQTRRQLQSVFGEEDAQALFALTNNLVIFGGSKDVRFNDEISNLLGPVRVKRRGSQRHEFGGGRELADIPIVTGAEIRRLKQRTALVIAENGKPIVAKLHRVIDGDAGAALLRSQARLREKITGARAKAVDIRSRTTAAHAAARERGMTGWGGGA